MDGFNFKAGDKQIEEWMYRIHACIPSMVLEEKKKKKKHIHILHHLSKIISHDLFELASHSNNDNQSKSDKALLNALALSDVFFDFIIGMFSIIHTSQVAHLIHVYFESLEASMDHNDTWSMRCSCHLRIRAIEKLTVMPRFIALNFPPKYASYFKGSHDCALSSNESTFQFKDNDRLPETQWLATLLGNNCLSTCSICSEAVQVSNLTSYIQLLTNEFPRCMDDQVTFLMYHCEILSFQLDPFVIKMMIISHFVNFPMQILPSEMILLVHAQN